MLEQFPDGRYYTGKQTMFSNINGLARSLFIHIVNKSAYFRKGNMKIGVTNTSFIYSQIWGAQTAMTPMPPDELQQGRPGHRLPTLHHHPLQQVPVPAVQRRPGAGRGLTLCSARQVSVWW